jgi:hypothetical protein
VSDPHGQELARFEASASELRTFALVRGVCGVIALLASALTLLGSLPIPAFLIALLGVVISLVWLGQARKYWRSTAKPAQLVVYRAGFEVDQEFIPFTEVSHFEVDEDRLDVKVTLNSGDTRRIEPRYRGVDIYTLVRTLQDALTATRSTNEARHPP